MCVVFKLLNLSWRYIGEGLVLYLLTVVESSGGVQEGTYDRRVSIADRTEDWDITAKRTDF